MSLDFNFSKVKDRSVWEGPNDQLTPTARTLVFSTMAIGMDELTEKNFEEFFDRLHTVEMVYGSNYTSKHPETGEDVPIFFTKEEIRPFIGFFTNASSKTRREFDKNMKDAAFRFITNKHKSEFNRFLELKTKQNNK